MFDNLDEKKILTKTQLTITLLLALFLSVTGATYAYFAISATNNTITGTAATVNLTLDVTKVFPTSTSWESSTKVMVPQLSSALSKALKSGCVDDNNNVVCQVYHINVQNIGGTATQVVDGWVSFYSNPAMTADVASAMPNLKWKLITSANATTPSSSVLGNNDDLAANANENVFANDLIMATGANENYYMIVWIDETNEDQPTDEGKTFYGKIEFASSNGTGVTSTFTA